MASIVNKNAHPDSVMTMNNSDNPQIPQSKKGMSISEALDFLDQVMAIFRSVEDMSDLKTMFETGKQLSRLYFDCPNQRSQLADLLNAKYDFPGYASKMMKRLNNMGVFKNDDIWFSSFYFYNITWNFSDCSPGFATNLGLAGLPNLLNLNIGHQPYLDNLSSKNVYYLMKASLSLMHNIARVPGNSHYFTDDSVKTALSYLANREEEFLKCVATLTLAYIVGDKDPSSPNATPSSQIDADCAADVVKKLVLFIQQAIKSEKRRYHGFTIEELVAAMAALAVNGPSSRLIGASPANTIGLLKELCLPPSNNSLTSPLECEYACRALWNLAFDSSLRSRMVGSEYQLVPLLNQIKSNHASPTVAKMAEGALWVMAEEGRRLEAIRKTPAMREPTAKEAYVFISYSWSDKENVLRIQEKLREAELPCWIDVERLSEVTIPAVAKAIEQSKVVMVCMSEAYRSSPNCRTEARYAHSLGKPVVPAVMQARYHPDAWLPDLLEDTPHFDFGSRRNFDATFEQMLVVLREILAGDPEPRTPSPEINNTTSHPSRPSVDVVQENKNKKCNDIPMLKGGDNHTMTANNVSGIFAGNHGVYPLPAALRVSPEVLKWSRNDVAHWLERNGLNNVAPQMATMDGRLLAQMCHIRREAPEFYYRCLDTKMGFQFVDILKFSEAILKLTAND